MCDAHAGKSSRVPEEYAHISLCIEWGISWQEYLETPDDIIGKALEYKQAEVEGQKRQQAENK